MSTDIVYIILFYYSRLPNKCVHAFSFQPKQRIDPNYGPCDVRQSVVNSLSIFHLNTRSVRHKLSYLTEYLLDNHIVCFIETHLDDTIEGVRTRRCQSQLWPFNPEFVYMQSRTCVLHSIKIWYQSY